MERHRERRDASTKSFSLEHAPSCARLAPHRGKQCLPDAIALKRAAHCAMFVARFVTDSQRKCNRHDRAGSVREDAFEEYFPVVGHFSRVIFLSRTGDPRGENGKESYDDLGNYVLLGRSCLRSTRCVARKLSGLDCASSDPHIASSAK